MSPTPPHGSSCTMTWESTLSNTTLERRVRYYHHIMNLEDTQITKRIIMTTKDGKNKHHWYNQVLDNLKFLGLKDNTEFLRMTPSNLDILMKQIIHDKFGDEI